MNPLKHITCEYKSLTTNKTCILMNSTLIILEDRLLASSLLSLSVLDLTTRYKNKTWNTQGQPHETSW